LNEGPPPVVTVTQLANGGTMTETIAGFSECERTEGPGVEATWRVRRIVYSDLDNLTHEALHGADCADDGLMNGSPLPYAPTWEDAAHEFVYWCLANEAECIEIMGRTR
jgi:hypothetical protein